MPAMTAPLTRSDVAAIYHSPLLELIARAGEVHRRHHEPGEVQVCVLLSVKTGGCPEDCGYCPQAARYHTSVEAEPRSRRHRSFALCRSLLRASCRAWISEARSKCLREEA